MKYEALCSFTGKITKKKGDVFEINNDEVAKDLIQAKFIKKADKEVEISKEEETVNEN